MTIRFKILPPSKHGSCGPDGFVFLTSKIGFITYMDDLGDWNSESIFGKVLFILIIIMVVGRIKF